LYDDVKDEIINKTANNVESLTGVLGGMINNFHKIGNSVSGLIMNNTLEPDLDEQEISDLNTLKDQLRNLEEKVEVDMEKDNYVTEDVEKMIQQFLTSTRQLVSELGKSGEVFWSKMKQVEVEFYRVKVAMADGSGELKEEVSDLFDTLKKVDLNQIGALEHTDMGDTQEVPRDF